MIPFSLWTVFADRPPLLLTTKTNEWPLSSSKSLCVKRNESSIWQAFSLLINKNNHWTLSWIKFFLCNSLVSHQFSSINVWLLSELQRVEFWKNVPLDFHWLTIDSIKVAEAVRRCSSSNPMMKFLEFLPLLENWNHQVVLNDHEMFLRIARFRREEFLRDQVELVVPFSKKFSQIVLIYLIKQPTLFTLEKTQHGRKPIL